MHSLEHVPAWVTGQYEVCAFDRARGSPGHQTAWAELLLPSLLVRRTLQSHDALRAEDIGALLLRKQQHSWAMVEAGWCHH